MRTVLVAVGGHALIHADGPARVDVERLRLAETCRALAGVAPAGWRLLVTHGNGPQVGAALRRMELARAEVYPLPLDLCVAGTQGEIGLLLQQELDAALAARGVVAPVAALVTQVVVARRDRAFRYPTKPIGLPGFQRVVPSPEPLDIVEEPVIRALLDAGVVVIALGGGGVPVVRSGARYEGVEAVVDKDLASSLLAVRLGVDLFVMLTDVDGIYLNFATPAARRLGDVTAGELRRHAAEGHFPPGTMGPKVEAALRFVTATGGEAIVTSPDRLLAALGGEAGTHVFHETGSDLPWRRAEVSGAPGV
ncbi:MAG: carbamate kinase [Acidobacteria bacterium]|nr:carbamate kinase [Acidobacteriota bacterium]